MSQAVSPSAQRPYGLVRVTRVWRVARSTVYLVRNREQEPLEPAKKRGPSGGLSDAALLVAIRQSLVDSPWVGEGHRKAWARLRFTGVRTSRRRVLRLMREANLLAPTRAGQAHGPKAHDGAIITARPDQRWGTDGTSTLTDEGNATIFIVVDHCTSECLGIHAARRGTRFEALEPLRQAVRTSFGEYREGIASDLELRHDHGSMFVAEVYQDEVRFLGITSSPSFVREPEGNGCAERFIRTLKEQLLWLRRFATIEELRLALQAFREQYNREWLIERHGYLSPSAMRAKLVGEIVMVAA
jgi:transposase InsO family protein